MDTRSWTDEHSRAIAAVAPSVPEAAPDELDRTWAKVRKEMADTPSRRRARIVVGAAIAAAALGVGGVAAADIYSAHTARTGEGPVDAEDERLGGPGEKLDLTAPDYGTVILEETTDIPFPNEEARMLARDFEVGTASRDRNQPYKASTSTGAVRYFTAKQAVCAWANEWAAATTAGDEAARATAIGMIDESSTWPAVTDVDPAQKYFYKKRRVTDPETGRKVTKKVVVDETPAAALPPVQEAAHGDDIDAMSTALLDFAPCVREFMGDLPAPDDAWWPSVKDARLK